MPPGIDLSLVVDFATALALGALVGMEREKRLQEPGQTGTAGLRTFILYAEVGAIGGWLAKTYAQPWLLLAAVAVVAVLVVAGYVGAVRRGPRGLGLTTEIAALVVCLLGGMTLLGERELAIGLGILTAALLAYKQPLHGLLEKLGWDDVFAGLRLLIATFIVLPLLPDHAVDPWGALVPSKLWLLVILISSLSLVGYALTRWLGSGRGTLLTGLTGGLVSSTAVTLAFARRCREERAGSEQLLAGILVAWTVMFGRVLVEVAVVNRALLPALALPFGAMGLVGLAVTAWAVRRGQATRAGGQSPDLPLRNPFSLLAAARFAALFAAVLLAVKLVQTHFPGNSVHVVAMLAGTTDVDAITLSMAQSAGSGNPTAAGLATTAIVLATLTNTLVKCGLVLALAGPALRRPILIATGLIAAAGLGAAWST